MTLAHVTQTGNVSIPKKWRDELGIEPESDVILQKTDNKIIIEPLKKGLKGDFKRIDDEMERKKIVFTRGEAVKDDLYD